MNNSEQNERKGFEARWNNQIHQVACADTIESAVSTLMSLTHGEGIVYIYPFGKDGVVKKDPIKII